MHKLIAAAVLSVAANLAAAQTLPGDTRSDEPERIEVVGDWAVFATDRPRECFATSRAQAENGWPDAAGGAMSQILVTFRPQHVGRPGELSFWAGGRPIAPGTSLGVQSGEGEFLLFTDGEWAWPPDSVGDANAIALLSQGGVAVVDLIAPDMSPVQVRFSLDGFAEAVTRAADYCALIAPPA